MSVVECVSTVYGMDSVSGLINILIYVIYNLIYIHCIEIYVLIFISFIKMNCVAFWARGPLVVCGDPFIFEIAFNFNLNKYLQITISLI